MAMVIARGRVMAWVTVRVGLGLGLGRELERAFGLVLKLVPQKPGINRQQSDRIH